MDGVIYWGNERIPGVLESLKKVKEDGHTIYFLTNNATMTRESFKQKLAKMDISSDSSHIMTSAYATAIYLKNQQAEGKRVLAVGEEGLVDELNRIHVEVVSEPPADYVVVGLDRRFNYQKLMNAQQAIMGGAKFIATNLDPVLPQENNRFIPGGGSIVSAVQTASGTTPYLIGKPSTYSLEIILNAESASKEDAIVIGDRLDTDIKLGNSFGVKTVLVLTGVTNREAGEKAPKEMKPTGIIENMTKLPEILNKL